jgi:hypothetical protein
MDKPAGAGAAAAPLNLQRAIPTDVEFIYAVAGEDKSLNLRGRTIIRVEVNGQEATFIQDLASGAVTGCRVRIPMDVKPGMGRIVSTYDDGSKEVRTFAFLPQDPGQVWADAFLEGLESFPRVAAGSSFVADHQEETVRVSINKVETSFTRVENSAVAEEYRITVPTDVRLGLGEICLERKDGRRVWSQLVFSKPFGAEAPKSGEETKTESKASLENKGAASL